ncbi:RHS repeat-associated core domain-containing protein [candidate division WOR-3 bacterium]|nr:RHS repeat-associated core domain-containing protein [candidate division WOR-3 bacterium]
MKTFNGPWGNGTYNYTSNYAISRRYQEIIGSNTTTYSYHGATHRLSSTTGADQYTFTYDNNGNLTGITGKLILTYDYENRPVFINNLESRTTDFVYNAKGERVKKVLGGAIPPKDNQQPEAIAGEQYYYLTGLSGEALCEIERFGRIKTYYVYLNGRKLCKVRVTYKYFYHNDHLGSAKAMSDNSGTKIYAWLGYPFGKQYSIAGASYNNYRFTGKEFDQSTGLYYFGARYYMPEIGRFITADPIMGTGSLNRKKPIAMNLYNYCVDNPTRYVDPDGRDVRTVAEMREHVADAYRRSATFREIYDGLRQNREVLVWIGREETNPQDKKPYRGKTMLREPVGGRRQIWCFVVSSEAPTTQGYLIGHELVHATEIAGNEDITTEADYENWQQEMVKAKKARFTDAGWCTYNARDKQNQMYQEIINDIKGRDDIVIEDRDIFKPYLAE